MQPTRPTRPGNSTTKLKKLERQTAWLGIFCLVVMPVFVLVRCQWMDWQDEQVASSESIGTVQRITGVAPAAVVLETETGYYPLSQPVAAQKGAPVILEVRRSGKRFVCDQQRLTCSLTAGETITNRATGRQN